MQIQNELWAFPGVHINPWLRTPRVKYLMRPETLVRFGKSLCNNRSLPQVYWNKYCKCVHEQAAAVWSQGSVLHCPRPVLNNSTVLSLTHTGRQPGSYSDRKLQKTHFFLNNLFTCLAAHLHKHKLHKHIYIHWPTQLDREFQIVQLQIHLKARNLLDFSFQHQYSSDSE